MGLAAESFALTVWLAPHWSSGAPSARDRPRADRLSTPQQQEFLLSCCRVLASAARPARRFVLFTPAALHGLSVWAAGESNAREMHIGGRQAHRSASAGESNPLASMN